MRTRISILFVVVLFCCSQTPLESQVARVEKVLSGADYLFPRISPDGKRVAFSQVIVAGGVESTQILLYSIDSGHTDTLLSQALADSVGVYATYAIDLQWRTGDTLEARLSDGDVGGTSFVLDATNKLVLGHQILPEFDDVRQLPDPMWRQISSAHPQLPAEVVSSCFTGSPLPIVGPDGVVLQKNYSGQDLDIWYLAKSSPLAKAIIHSSNLCSFGGGFFRDGSFLILAKTTKEAQLFRYDGKKPDLLVSFPAPKQTPDLMIRYQDAQSTWFIVKGFENSEVGNNPAFVYKDGKLTQLNLHDKLCDFDVHPATRLLVFSYWIGDIRSLAIARY